MKLKGFLIGIFLVGNLHLYGGVRTFSRYLPDKVITLDPLNSFERYSSHAILQIYSPIFKTEDGITPIPHIAKDYIYNKVNNEFIINIRKDIFFHDKIPLTVEDIIFTIKRLCQKMNGKIRILPLIKGKYSANPLLT